MNRRQHKRRIYKRMGHQLVCYPFAGCREAFIEFCGKLADCLRSLNERLAQSGIDHGTKDTQAQATGSHQ